MRDPASKAAGAPRPPAPLAPAEADIEKRADGTLYLRGRPLGEYHGKISQALERWAQETPDRFFLAQRDNNDRWRELSYAATLDKVRRIAATLLRRGLS